MVVALGQYIEITEDVRGGRPCVAGTRLTVADIAMLHLRVGLTLVEIAGKYDLDMASVHAAMVYYYEHRKEIDTRIAEDQTFTNEMEKNGVTPLQKKRVAV